VIVPNKPLVSSENTAEIPVRVERVYFSIPEIPNENIAAEPAEGERCARDAPWRIQRPAASEAPQQITVGIENVDKAISGTGDVVVLRGVLLGVRDEETAVDILDAERRITVRNFQVGEVPFDL
jgi:hypothetical protein